MEENPKTRRDMSFLDKWFILEADQIIAGKRHYRCVNCRELKIMAKKPNGVYSKGNLVTHYKIRHPLLYQQEYKEAATPVDNRLMGYAKGDMYGNSFLFLLFKRYFFYFS